ncbi:hypothetical protein D1610_04495 [Sphingomonas gilva]|uniref:Uncharacterized protein n=1 Tax=Sphingomonas gilva TaxID=2305907 RepID=A0A396RRR4_9SPHN|nr:hypothetical protein [Sphingomonas gilva]RHW19367.1 hypothetical protein D1610_04495 [Sphingomonas gilva]
MSIRRKAYFLAFAGAMLAGAAPASAQFFLNPPKFASGPVSGSEPGIMLPLPGATPEEQRAALLWNLRSGLNVAALQCQFEPTLLTLSNYNAMLNNHRDELAASFETLTEYFQRTAKTKKEAQTLLDQYGTKTYQGFSVVGAQRTFCSMASDVGQDAIWAPRGALTNVAINRMRELRGSLVYTREPIAYNPWLPPGQGRLPVPNLDDRCWDKKGQWRKRCNPDD